MQVQCESGSVVGFRRCVRLILTALNAHLAMNNRSELNIAQP